MIEYIIITCIVIIFYIRTIEFSIIIDDIRNYAYHKGGAYTFKKERFNKEGIKYLIQNIREKLYGAGTFGLNTIYDHAFTTFLHAVTCCLIYPAFGSTPISFSASLLYAVNPINNQTAIWLNGRRYQIVIILSLLALLTKPFGLIFYPATLLFQHTAFFLPILFLDFSPLFILILPILILFGLPKIQEIYFQRMNRIWNDDQKTWGIKRFTVVIKTYGFYFFKMIFPGTIMFHSPKLIKWGVTEAGNKDAYAINREFYKGIVALLLTLAMISINDLSLYAIFMALAILQWSAIICAFQQLCDRYISLANVFMMYLIAWFSYQTPYGLYIITALFFYYATQLNVTMQMYKTIDRFYEYQIFFDPSVSRIRLYYADSFLQMKDATRAWLIVEMGLRYDPDDFELLFMAAKCSAMVGLFEKAEEFIKRAENNYYVGQEEMQKKRISELRYRMATTYQQYQQQMNVSRQVKRAQDRKSKT